MERIDDLNINNMKIIQNTEYFLFGMDSVLLANMIKKTNSKMCVVDLGTGSAVIPIILSQKTNVEKILGVEIQKEMYDLAIKNVRYNNLEEKINIVNMDLKDSKLLKKHIVYITEREEVDIVVSNPPYKETAAGIKNKKDVRCIARHEINCTLEDIFKTTKTILKSKGRLYIVHKPERLVDLISIARKYKLEAKKITFMQPTVEKAPSLVLIEYVKDGGNECVVTKPLIEFDNEGKYTKEIKEIYEMEEKKCQKK